MRHNTSKLKSLKLLHNLPLLWLSLAIFPNLTSMNKVVLEVEIYDDKTKKKAMKAVSSLSGVESVSVDLKNQKLTLTGDIDPVDIVGKLRKLCRTEILSVGPAQEEKKKKKETKKDDKKEVEVKKNDQHENLVHVVKIHECYQPHYYYTSVEENPNACAIC